MNFCQRNCCVTLINKMHARSRTFKAESWSMRRAGIKMSARTNAATADRATADPASGEEKQIVQAVAKGVSDAAVTADPLSGAEKQIVWAEAKGVLDAGGASSREDAVTREDGVSTENKELDVRGKDDNVKVIPKWWDEEGGAIVVKEKKKNTSVMYVESLQKYIEVPYESWTGSPTRDSADIVRFG